jgi:hypothetical protein
VIFRYHSGKALVLFGKEGHFDHLAVHRSSELRVANAIEAVDGAPVHAAAPIAKADDALR